MKRILKQAISSLLIPLLISTAIASLFYACIEERNDRIKRCEAMNGFYIESDGICVPKDKVIF